MNETEDINIISFHQRGEDLYWHGCYNTFRDWRKYVTAESFAHPAKMAPGLCDRIFKHLKKLGLLHEDSVVCDFMAGIGTTNIMAALHGYDSISVELEPHFVEMLKNNRARLKRITGKSNGWQVIQGDARVLSSLLKEKGCVGVVSPPYSDAQTNPGNVGNEMAKRQAITGSAIDHKKDGYSSNPSNIGNLKDKPLVGVISPPYSEAQQGGGIAVNGYRGPHINEMGKNQPDKVGQRCGYMKEVHGFTEGQIGNLPDREKKLAGIVSPPYEEAMGIKHTDCGSSAKFYEDKHWNTKYSTNKDNIGAVGGETYLEAMLKVYQEAYKSGISPLVTVTKNPTRNGQLRRLDMGTANLLMMAGYEIVDYHRAVLFEERQQCTLDGEVKKEPKGRLSFFKRLSYQKGNVVARWEDVIFAEKK